jgi:hypothetical protein
MINIIRVLNSFSGQSLLSLTSIIIERSKHINIWKTSSIKMNSIHLNAMRRRPYMNPYLAGVLLGLVLLGAMVLSGRGLGASGGIKYCVVSLVGAVSQDHTATSEYYSKYYQDGKKPINNWLVFQILGMVLGGFISGAISGRLTWKIEKSPKISKSRRLVLAFLGGVFFVYGGQMARGCTSGAALSGMAVLTTAGFVTMIAIFGSGYLFAWFFRKNWI